jgi:secreted PhoX family phosphatase
MKKKLLTIAISGALAVSAYAYADSGKHKGYFNFKAIGESANKADWDPAAPWKLPKGYRQTLVSGEDALNIYDGGRDDWHDMNTVNETGPDAGRYLYRTHELRFPDNQPEGGAISVVDLKTGETNLLASDPTWDALDGIRWTPWGTLLFAEEKTGGRLFEIELNDDMVSVKAIHDRPAVGRLAHEGIDLDADGNVYIVDEYRGRTEDREEYGNTCAGELPCGGGIYKFVPDNYGDLSSGNLYVLGIEASTRRDGTGQGVWLGPIDAENARAAGTTAGGQSYQRPEDLEIIGKKLYAAITEGPRDEYGKEYYEGRVIAVDLKKMTVSNFVKAGMNVPVEIGIPGDEVHQSGFDSVDNLAEAADGQLIMIEDNKPSDIWFASTRTNKYGASRKVKLFASLTDPSAEGTGIYISPTDPKTLYVNIQHSEAEDGDGTWAITRKGYR